MDDQRRPGAPYARDPKAKRKFYIYSAILFAMGLFGSLLLANCIVMAEMDGPRSQAETVESEEGVEEQEE